MPHCTYFTHIQPPYQEIASMSLRALVVDAHGMFKVLQMRSKGRVFLCFSPASFGGGSLYETFSTRTLQKRNMILQVALPPSSRRGICFFSSIGSPPFSPRKSYYFYRISSMNPLFSLIRTGGANRDAKWWPSKRCMFDSPGPTDISA